MSVHFSIRDGGMTERVRILLGETTGLGPGKAHLLEAIADGGSISGAARALGMSYRRAWRLIEAMNQSFAGPLVDSVRGGAGGGGARLTALGAEVLGRYRAMEAKAAAAIADDLAAFAALRHDGGKNGKPEV